MAVRGIAFYDNQGQYFKSAEEASASDLAGVLGRVGDGDSLAPGIARIMLAKRVESGRPVETRRDRAGSLRYTIQVGAGADDDLAVHERRRAERVAAIERIFAEHDQMQAIGQGSSSQPIVLREGIVTPLRQRA